MKCLALINCQFYKALPIKEMPITCNGKRRIAVAGSEGWHANLFRATVQSECGAKKYYVTAYVNNVIIPIPAEAVKRVDLEEYARSVLKPCVDGFGSPLSELIYGCHVRAIHCFGKASEEKVAALVAAWGIVNVSKTSVELPYGKIKGNCVELRFDEGGLSKLRDLDAVLALVKLL